MRTYILCLSLLFLSLPCQAQNFQFEYLGKEDGLKSNKVFMTLEDTEGFIWIATESGVCKYDGRNLKSYTLEELEVARQGLFVSLFLDLDTQGTIWLALSTGQVFYYDPGLDQFVYHNQILSDTDTQIYVGDFHIDHEDRFVVGSYTNAFFYDPDSAKSYKVQGINTTVKSITQGADHSYYFGCRDGIHVFDQNLKFLFNLKDKEINGRWIPGENRKIESLFLQESAHKLWIGSEKSGFFYYDLAHDEISTDQLNGEIDLHIRSIKDIGNGNLMVGTDGGGVYIFDSFESRILDRLVYDDQNENSLNSNAVYDIFISSQGIVFISTYRGGVNIYNPQSQNFSFLRHKAGNSNSLKNDVVYSIQELSPGLISFGTEMGISFWEQASNSWRHVSLDPSSDKNKNEVAWSQSIDKNGNLWVASFTHSLVQFEPQGDDVSLKPAQLDFLGNSIIKKTYIHPTNGELLLGTIDKGLFVYYTSGEVENYPIPEATDFETYSSEKVIIGNRNGIAVLDLEYNEITWMNDDLVGETLKNKAIISLLIDKERNVWVGTWDHGVYVFNANLSTVRAINTSVGLASNNIIDLVNDSEGNVWVATSLGISKIEGDKVLNFYKSDGLISTDFNRNTAILDGEGKLFFGTNQGVVTFDPKSIKPPEINKKLVLTDFYLNHERIIAGEKAVLSKSLNQTDVLKLTHNQNSFSIGFSSIDFVHPEQGEYTWKLEGFDPKWIAGNNQFRATYTNLNPGSYTFRLRLTDQLGNLLSPENQVEIIIVKPFWLTAWAYAFYTLFLGALIALLLYSNRLRMESKNAEKRLHFLIEMAHEIKTPLTLIRASINDLLSNNEADTHMQESLGVALKSAEKLQGQMRQFLDFKRTNTRKNNLQITSVDLIALINRKIYAFQLLADRKLIQIEFKHDQEEFIIKSDQKILDKIISNLLSNAIKYTLEKGVITLRLNTLPQKWTLAVQDTGIGISKEDQRKIFTLFFRAENAKRTGSTGSGVGLVLARDLAKTLDGTVKLAHTGETGSEFVVTIPITQTIKPDEFVKEKETEKIETQRMEEEVRNGAKVKILIVEDDEEFRQYQKQKFEHKYHIQTAANGEQALKMVNTSPPDLIISDVKMPIMNGLQLCMNIKSNVATSHIPFILLTGLESKENIQQGFESGADDYIVKLFDFEILASKINNFLQTRAAFKDKFVASEDEFEYKDLTNELDQQFLDEITSLVEDNISDPDLSVNVLCQAMGMSRTSFYHKLKSLIDMSPSEFIRTIRLKRAKKLLLHPGNNISEVAYSTGFADAKYFSTLFKKYYNQSPSSFVAEKRKASQSS